MSNVPIETFWKFPGKNRGFAPSSKHLVETQCSILSVEKTTFLTMSLLASCSGCSCQVLIKHGLCNFVIKPSLDWPSSICERDFFQWWVFRTHLLVRNIETTLGRLSVFKQLSKHCLFWKRKGVVAAKQRTWWKMKLQNWVWNNYIYLSLQADKTGLCTGLCFLFLSHLFSNCFMRFPTVRVYE